MEHASIAKTFTFNVSLICYRDCMRFAGPCVIIGVENLCVVCNEIFKLKSVEKMFVKVLS